MAQRFSKPPSEYWGIEDPGIAFDFDRLHSLRLAIYEAQIAKAQADAMRGDEPQDVQAVLEQYQTAAH